MKLKRWHIALGVGVTFALLVVALLAFPRTAEGRVGCADGSEVAGVFIATPLRSDFAEWQKDPEMPNWATWKHPVSLGAPYRVDVGCGKRSDDPKEWQTNNKSEWLFISGQDLLCSTPQKEFFGTCHSTPS